MPHSNPDNITVITDALISGIHGPIAAGDVIVIRNWDDGPAAWEVRFGPFTEEEITEARRVAGRKI